MWENYSLLTSAGVFIHGIFKKKHSGEGWRKIAFKKEMDYVRLLLLVPVYLIIAAHSAFIQIARQNQIQ